MINGANQWWMASECCPVCWRKTCSCNSGGELIGAVFIFVVIPVIVVSLSSITDIGIGIADQPIKFKLTQQFPPPSIFHWKVLLAEHDYLDSDLPVRNYIVLTSRSMRILQITSKLLTISFIEVEDGHLWDHHAWGLQQQHSWSRLCPSQNGQKGQISRIFW